MKYLSLRFNRDYLGSINYKYNSELFKERQRSFYIDDYILKVENSIISPSKLLIILNFATVVGEIIFKDWTFIINKHQKFAWSLNFEGLISLHKITLDNIKFMYFNCKELTDNKNDKSIKISSIKNESAWKELYNILLDTRIIKSIKSLIIIDISKQLDKLIIKLIDEYKLRNEDSECKVIYKGPYPYVGANPKHLPPLLNKYILKSK